MDEGGENPFAWPGGAHDAIELTVYAVVAVLIWLGVQALGKRKRRRADRYTQGRFQDIMEKTGLGSDEREILRELAEEAPVEDRANLLTSLAVFDGVAEKAVREAIEEGDRERVERLMRLLYSVRAQLFPQASVTGNEGKEQDPEQEG